MLKLNKLIMPIGYSVMRAGRKYRLNKKITNVMTHYKSKGGIIKINNTNEKIARDLYKKYHITNLKWHRWYTSVNNMFLPHYIPEDVFYTYIEPVLNRLDLQKGIDNKNMYDFYFKSLNIKAPKTIYRLMNGLLVDEQYQPILEENIIKPKKYICKSSIGVGGGHGIYFASSQDSVGKIITILGKDFLAQEIIEQHDAMSVIHPESVNTVRAISLMLDDEVIILSSVLRVGINGNKVDNQSSGGISAGIWDNGDVKSVAYSMVGEVFDKHPDTGIQFSSINIPYFNQIHSIIQKVHPAFSNFRIISWDFAIGKAEPILIEFNLIWQEINFHQINNGPLFGEYTDEVLKLCSNP